ncbi:MAG: HDOD domain-containing protein [Myxococcales bacterium]|nr:HDOD domain-containing protein [Myxococcales bacterium]
MLFSVERLFSSSVYRPPLLPAVALRVLELSRSQEASFVAIVDVIESDPLFAASVLRSASSPLYASKTPLRSIQQAKLRHGLQTLTDICVEVAMTGRVFKAQGYELPMEAIRRHSVAVGHAARLVAQRVGVAADNAFSLGLLHEAGLAVGVIALNTPGLWPNRFPPNRVWPVLSEVQVELLERLVVAWTLPIDLADGILNHHRGNAPIDGARAVLAIADRIASELGVGMPSEIDSSATLSQRAEIARLFLGLKLSDVAMIEGDVQRLVEKAV